MISIYDIDELTHYARRQGIPEMALKRFRVAFFKKGQPLDACLDALPEEVRAAFVRDVRLHELEMVERHDSQIDGASKLIFQTASGEKVESVVLRVASGRTSLCISSQIGCGADCSFCATGKMGLTRNLSTHEILDQVILVKRLLVDESRTLRNVVFMGMGEPFHNEKAVYEALELLRDPRGCYIADRHLMVSTVGVHKAMLRFAERFPKVGLALSLHSARQAVRVRIMPTGSFHSLARLRAAMDSIVQRGSLMVEVLLLEGVNDGPEDLASLIKYLEGLPVHINLIQFNPFPGSDFQPVTPDARAAFGDALRRAGFKVTLRYSLGDDIAAACGQLAGAS